MEPPRPVNTLDKISSAEDHDEISISRKSSSKFSSLRSPLILEGTPHSPDASSFSNKISLESNFQDTASINRNSSSSRYSAESFSLTPQLQPPAQIYASQTGQNTRDTGMESTKSTKPATKIITRQNSFKSVKSRPSSIPTTPSSAVDPEPPLSATSQYSANAASTAVSPVISSYSLENCSFNELKNILSEKLIQLSQVQHQNAQLWTLVNKQRTMIFDLQRDFDNAVEQNEKLAKQLEGLKTTKEPLSAVSSSSSSSGSTPALSGTFKVSRKPSKNELNASNESASQISAPILKISNLPTEDSRESSSVPSTYSSLGITQNLALPSQKADVSLNLSEDSEANPYTGNSSQTNGSPYSFTRSQNSSIRSAKHRPPPIVVPSDTLELSHAPIEKSSSTPLRSPSSESVDSSSSISKTPQTSTYLSSSFDFSNNPPNDETLDSTKSISSPQRSNSAVGRAPVLYVQPESLSTVSLEISTLIGKVKQSYKHRREDPVAIINALDRATGKELWKVIKDYTALIHLDNLIRPLLYAFNPPKLPDRSMFQSHAPTRVDARKVALESYFSYLLSHDLPRYAAQILCEFLSVDTIDPMDVPDNPSRHEGYLTKRGKKIRVWKVRYFVIENDSLNCYDKPGGELQGTISLQDAKIGRQAKNETDTNSEESVEKAFRHAFLLLEQRKKSYVRHVLCAESDEDRDHWIDALLEVIAEYTSSTPSQVLPPSTPTVNSPLANFDGTSPTYKAEKFEENSRLSNIPPPFITNVQPAASSVSPSATLLVSAPPPSNRGTVFTSGAQANSSKLSVSAPNEIPPYHDLRPTGSTATNHSISSGNLIDSTDNAADADDFDGSREKEGKRSKKKSFFSFRNKSSTNTPNVGLTMNSSANNEGLFNNQFQATPYSAVEQQPMNPKSPDLPYSNAQTGGAILLLHAQQQLSPQTPQTPIHLEKQLSIPKHTHLADDSSTFHQEGANDDFNDTKNGSHSFNDNSSSNISALNSDGTSKRIFGISLSEAVQLSYKDVHHCRVPSIVYRCIELLKVRDAIFEEGIFRLSGSTATIRILKEKFNNEYDVDLVNSETYYDIHAVAGLLKLYLREIPTLILSSYLAPEFRDAVEISDVTTKILKLKSLVQELPRENRDLLCVLCSLLTEVIAHQDINKMNLRNVGIVFALTLNISSSVLTSFLTDFDSIFGDAAPDEAKARAVVDFPPHTELL